MPFLGYGWNVTRVGDANDIEMLARAFEVFRKEQERPTLIIVDGGAADLAPSTKTRLTLEGAGDLEAENLLGADGIRMRAVSMPSWELFERQREEYRNSVLPRQVKARVAVEQGSALGWHSYVGLDGEVIARCRPSEPQHRSRTS
jgi:transketolase